MIEAIEVCKSFDKICAVDRVSIQIKEGNVFGLVGTNGAGKSTFLRLAAGVYKPDFGSITIDGEEIYENPKAKNKFCYLSDDQHFFQNATPKDMGRFYGTVYKYFDEKKYLNYLEKFGLESKRNIATFSKGMKKQVSILLGICTNTNYLYCDETFDGLDPVMRQGVKSIFALEMAERGLTPIIASHNLRELEDICDHVGLLHRGGVLLSRDLEDMKCNMIKVQGVFPDEITKEDIFNGCDCMKIEKKGSLYTATVRGREEDILGILNAKNPLFIESMPLSLEEIFISEAEVVGYDIKKLIF